MLIQIYYLTFYFTQLAFYFQKNYLKFELLILISFILISSYLFCFNIFEREWKDSYRDNHIRAIS